ncbi:MAG: winged helix-turn-helix domain-containing protein [Myxococcota bacterium]
MNDVIQVIDAPEAAIAALKPMRAQLLAALETPRSAAELAGELGLPRQKVRYHLQALLEQGLVREAAQRKWGGITERQMVATAGSYLVSPAVLGPVAPDPARTEDRLSASYLLALAGRVVREVGALSARAEASDKRLATLSIDTTVRFASPGARAAFAGELVDALLGLVAKYHTPDAPEGRDHRVVLGAHPLAEEAP